MMEAKHSRMAVNTPTPGAPMEEILMVGTATPAASW
jgi:hypothetical protein